ncbi:protein kinase [Hyphomicrobium sp.]|uniref:protein kinase domain-containing protein n=1 Tax=Hyphomicrobium sp. TaxID=82 RepID=UPI002BF3C5C0|nr:protein kinase [Hyphomicrobium sp.]HRN89064.1 protein kinase [Hyphomicrobium sp.]HRQ27657.1 protein kinase [Hyphomicrobium sp.]
MEGENDAVLKAGTRIDQYTITGVLGRGGFGITYRINDEMLHKEFALKEFFPEDLVRRENGGLKFTSRANAEEDYRWALKKFFDEARLLAQFNHPNIIGVRRVFQQNDTAYMVLDLIQGRTLETWLRGLDSPPTQDELDLVAAPLLSALELVHENRTWHLDISPENIMVRGADGMPILLDFGASRFEIKQHSQLVSALVFKSGYSAPEQYVSTADRYGPWTDIYAFGATLYRAVAGERPSEATARQLADDLVPAVEVGAGRYRARFLEAIDEALRLSPESRPQSVAEWRSRLLAGSALVDDGDLLPDEANAAASHEKDGTEPAEPRLSVYMRLARTRLAELPQHPWVAKVRGLPWGTWISRIPHIEKVRALPPRVLAASGAGVAALLLALGLLVFNGQSGPFARCGGLFSGADCWGAVVDSGGNIFARVQERSREAAEAAALKSCNEKLGRAECHVIARITKDQCWSLAEVSTDPARWKAATGPSIERAETDARWACERAFGVCHVALTFCADGTRGH